MQAVHSNAHASRSFAHASAAIPETPTLNPKLSVLSTPKPNPNPKQLNPLNPYTPKPLTQNTCFTLNPGTLNPKP